MKYNEKEILQEIHDYIEGTYGQHYVGKNAFQIQDLLHSIDIAVPFCQANAIKYLARYGKKGGANRMDLLKAIHYGILLMHFSEDNDNTEDEVINTFLAEECALGNLEGVPDFDVHSDMPTKLRTRVSPAFPPFESDELAELKKACDKVEPVRLDDVVPTARVPRRPLQAPYSDPLSEADDLASFMAFNKRFPKIDKRFWEDIKYILDVETSSKKFDELQEFLDKTIRKEKGSNS